MPLKTFCKWHTSWRWSFFKCPKGVEADSWCPLCCAYKSGLLLICSEVNLNLMLCFHLRKWRTQVRMTKYLILFFMLMFMQLPIRPRLKRVNLRDLLFLLEQEKETCRTPLLYKAFLKWWWLCLVFLSLWQEVRSGDIKKLSSLPSHTLTEWVLFLCKCLDTSTKSLDSEANKYYVPWISWELSDTANYSQVNCVMFFDCEWIFYQEIVIFYTNIRNTNLFISVVPGPPVI